MTAQVTAEVFGWEVPAPSQHEFTLFQRLIHEETGIHLAASKKDLLVARLRKRVRELGLASFGEYYAHVVGDEAERTRMLDRISTNETRFFREPQQLRFLSERVLPRLRGRAADDLRSRRLRVWSAGCSTGEEPYTIAMIAREQLPAGEGWEIEILATDLSTRVLARAEEGCYSIERAPEIPESSLRSWMLRGVRSREGWMCVAPELRALVRFARLNLCTDLYPSGPFDLVLCRNVLIYFDGTTRERVVERLIEQLSPDGLLLLGHAEGLSASLHGLHYAGPLSYARAPEMAS